jgi:phosphinothricin acetyltransferase
MSLIRLATPDDAKGILAIYAPYIRDTSITFETDIPSEVALSERIQTFSQNFPWLVCEINGVIAGYAYGSKHRERVAYQWSVECSVYIHDDFLKAGIATALYTALFVILKQQGFCNVYAVINLPNERSVKLHEKMGFEHFAAYKNVGYKLGKWKNVGWWQLIINDYTHEPSPPTSFEELNKDFVPDLFGKCSKKINVRC